MNGETQTGVGQGLALVRNYRNGNGWESLVVPFTDTKAVQDAIREHNRRITRESVEDAVFLLAETMGRKRMTADTIVGLATFLANKRTVHLDRVMDEYLNLRIWEARGKHEVGI